MEEKERYAEHTVAWELPTGDSVTKGNYNLAGKNYPIKLKIKPCIFTAKYECWSVRQTEYNHKYLILVEEEGKLKPAGSYSTKSKRLLMYNVKYTPPLTILEKIVTSCELFERM